MGDELTSVGLDVGTTTTQMVVSILRVENRGGAFTVPELVIGSREVIYRSPVHFTPLLGKDRIDGEKLRVIVESEYEKAGLSRSAVDTGAVIITGETSRKENARVVLDALSHLSGDFVVATAGPHLESVLAARGAGAVEFSERTGKTVLHMDIGGGTSNLAWIEDGKIVKTGCLNVGGRLVKLDEGAVVTYVSPVLSGISDLRVGARATREQLTALAEVLTSALEMAAGLRPATDLLEKLWTKEAGVVTRGEAAWQSPWDCGMSGGFPRQSADWLGMTGNFVISFSGGVADCIENVHPWLLFGDMGPILGQTIRGSMLCRGAYRLGGETIRATVIGAGSHSLQLSGSTVFFRNVAFPLKNLPVACLEGTDAHAVARALTGQDTVPVLFLPAVEHASYARIKELAAALARGFGEGPVYVAMEQDMAKALGQQLALQLPGREILCIDGIRLENGSYLDVGTPIDTALPVVVKTLILEK